MYILNNIIGRSPECSDAAKLWTVVLAETTLRASLVKEKYHGNNCRHSCPRQRS